MKINTSIKILEDHDLLTNEGFALDLGCGMANDSSVLRERGYDVTSVDIRPLNIPNFIQADITDFGIEKGKYSLIIANYVLPFLANKQIVNNLIKRMVDGLAPKGILHFVLFGEKDEWNGSKESGVRNDILFHSPSEIDNLGLDFTSKTEFKGIGSTKAGTAKFWHTYTFIFQKK